MEILGIACSYREGGNSEILIREALKGAEQEGAEISIIPLKDLIISPCKGCLSCAESGKCVTEDDMQIIYEAMERANGIIIGSPVYCWNICGQAKVMIDRTRALLSPNLRLSNKIGGIILSASRRGCMLAAASLTYWMISNHMIPTDTVDGYARQKGDIMKDKHAMNAAFEIGRLVTKLATKGFSYPEEFSSSLFQLLKKKGLDASP